MDPAFDLKPVPLVAQLQHSGHLRACRTRFQPMPTANQGHPRALGLLQAPGRRTKALAMVTDFAPGRTEGTAANGKGG